MGRGVGGARRKGAFQGVARFGRFFGRMFPDTPREGIENSLGSGVIVSPDGVVVTNWHVIADSDEITVALADRREFIATLLGAAAVMAALRAERHANESHEGFGSRSFHRPVPSA